MAKRVKEASNSAFKEVTEAVFQKSREIISNGAYPRIVADLIVKIANTKDPYIRYPVGEDAEKIFDLRNKSNDKEFEDFLLRLLNLKKRKLINTLNKI